MYFSLELVVQIKQKGGTGVENPHPRSFLVGIHTEIRVPIDLQLDA